jgi:hypothetical protein
LYRCPEGARPWNATEWNEDCFDELHYDDALWAYTIRAFEAWKNRDVDQWDDPVVDRLMLMGCPDWIDPNARMPASIQAMRFATVFGERLMQRIIKNEVEVRAPLYIFCRVKR